MNVVQLYVRVLSLLGPDARLGYQLAIGNILLAMVQFAEPVLFGSIVDILASSAITNAASSWGALASLLGAWIGFGLFVIACGALVALFAGQLAHRRRQAVLADYFEHVLQLPLKRHGGISPDQLMKLMLTGTDILWALWLALLREHLAAFVSLFVLLPLMLFLNWQLASIVIVLTVAFAFLTALTMRKTETLQGTVEDRYTELAERASDVLGRVALVQSFSRIDVEVAALRDVTARLLNAQMPVLSWWAVATVLARTATIVAMLTILPFGIWLHFHGQASIGEILAFMGIAALVLGRQEQAVALAARVRLDAPRLREFFGVLDTAPAVRDRLDAVDPGRAHGLVEFKDVSFSFDGKRSAVADLDFTALPGQIVALVGAAGAGKSTALALLHRDFDPQSGAVTIDGMDIRGITLSALRRNIGVVFRETPLFNRSLAENLQVAKPNASEEKLRAACERAQAADLLARDSEVLAAGAGERGTPLSDDERQRLAVARVFLKDPPILILEEATGAPDAAAEAKVQTALDEVMKGRTTLVIAHRRTTLRSAQRILVFHNGRIVETGTYDELMRRRGHFAALAGTFGATRSKPAATGS